MAVPQRWRAALLVFLALIVLVLVTLFALRRRGGRLCLRSSCCSSDTVSITSGSNDRHSQTSIGDHRSEQSLRLTEAVADAADADEVRATSIRPRAGRNSIEIQRLKGNNTCAGGTSSHVKRPLISNVVGYGKGRARNGVRNGVRREVRCGRHGINGRLGGDDDHSGVLVTSLRNAGRIGVRTGVRNGARTGRDGFLKGLRVDDGDSGIVTLGIGGDDDFDDESASTVSSTVSSMSSSAWSVTTIGSIAKARLFKRKSLSWSQQGALDSSLSLVIMPFSEI